MKSRQILIAVSAMMAVSTASRTAQAQIPAFPGAEGPGAVATGGRGGDVYHVFNLNPDKAGTVPGSLSYGINTAPSSGRTIVFDVGGTIYLAGQTANDTIRYSKGKVTIAGQTAPSPGITIAGTGVKWTNTNLILRNIAIRPNLAPVSFDAFSLQLNNSIVDHVSATWFTDEGISQTDAGENSTVQYAIIAEGLGDHAFGSLISTEIDGTKASFNHILYAHNVTRQPRIGSEKGDIGLVLNFTNNVIYDWYRGNAGTSGGTSQNSSTNFAGNYYIQGNDEGTNPFSGGSDTAGDTKIYQNGNFWDKNQNGLFDGTNGGTSMFSGEKTFVNTPFPVAGIDSVDTAAVALQRVLDYTGPNWQSRSPTDVRLVSQVRSNTGSDLDNLNSAPQKPEWDALMTQKTATTRPAGFDTDNDGMPNTWETAHGLSITSASNNADFDNDGYRNIEEYINDLSAWPAPATLVFANTNANGRYAEIGNWGNVWQPSRFDAAQINTGTIGIDAPGQQARALSIAQNSGNTAALSVTSGWLDIRQTLSVGPGGTGSVTQSGGVLRAGTSVTVGGTNNPGNYALSGGTLATPLLTKGTKGGNFNFTGGTLHADTVAFALTNAGGILAPGSDMTLQQMAAASMPDINKAVVAVQPLVGSTRVMGNLALQGGSLEIDIASASSFDKLTIDSTLSLGGALTVVPTSGYVPPTGTRWLIATATGISGNFTSITQGYGIEIQNGSSLYLVTAPDTTVTIAAIDAAGGEFGADQALSFTITRIGAITAALDVPLVASGTATAGSDYSGFAGTVTIHVGQPTVALPLTVLPDALSEGSETVIISLGASGNFTAGSPASASAAIADNPSQDYFFNTIADPAKRGPNDDADVDSSANILEYCMGSNPGDSGSCGTLTIPSTGNNTFKVRYPRAKNRKDVSSALSWSADLRNWFASGQSDGSWTVTFTESLVSEISADPETIEATGAIGGSGAANIFVRLSAQ